MVLGCHQQRLLFFRTFLLLTAHTPSVFQGVHDVASVDQHVKGGWGGVGGWGGRGSVFSCQLQLGGFHHLISQKAALDLEANVPRWLLLGGGEGGGAVESGSSFLLPFLSTRSPFSLLSTVPAVKRSCESFWSRRPAAHQHFLPDSDWFSFTQV